MYPCKSDVWNTYIWLGLIVCTNKSTLLCVSSLAGYKFTYSIYCEIFCSVWVNNYLLKVNNRSIWKRCEVCSKLVIKIPERCQSRRFAQNFPLHWVIYFSNIQVLLQQQPSLQFAFVDGFNRSFEHFTFLVNTKHHYKHCTAKCNVFIL